MNILLAVTGSISAYKTYDVTREFVKAGHKVKIILTNGALEFIKANTFSYLGAQDVYTAEDDFNTHKNQGKVLHINLKDWMDILVIAPASANTIAKISNGLCEDLLGSVFLSAQEKSILIFPAMNTQMYLNPITQKNIKILEELKNTFIHPPQEGLLACGEEGIGKLPELQTIFDITTTLSKRETGRKILITTGPTTVPIDPVRFLTNASSGKTGYELSKKYLSQGCNVVLIHGPNCSFPKYSLLQHPRYQQISVSTTDEMYKAVQEHFTESDVYISSAAISDFKFNPLDSKLKKDSTNPSLQFEWSVDILKEMINRKTNQKIISFAAETNDLANNFKRKWERKPVDLLVGNQVAHGQTDGVARGFAADENTYYLVEKGEISFQKEMSKKDLATYICHYTEDTHD